MRRSRAFVDVSGLIWSHQVIPDVVREILGAPLSNTIAHAFDLMRVAEEEIAAAKRRHPRVARRLHVSFMLLVPGLLSSAPESLYRKHCVELLGRVKSGKDVTPGTDAELAFVLMQASLAAPPDRDHACAYARVFARLFPARRDIVEGLEHESHAGAVDEILNRLRVRVGRDVARGRAT